MTSATDMSPLATYQAYLEKGFLAYQYSPQAGRAVFFPRLVCPFTGSQELEWRISCGSGVIHAITEISPRAASPYFVALIDMDEGFRLMSNVLRGAVQTGAVQPCIGARVAVRIERMGDGQVPCPVFELRDRHGE